MTSVTHRTQAGAIAHYSWLYALALCIARLPNVIVPGNGWPFNSSTACNNIPVSSWNVHTRSSPARHHHRAPLDVHSTIFIPIGSISVTVAYGAILSLSNSMHPSLITASTSCTRLITTLLISHCSMCKYSCVHQAAGCPPSDRTGQLEYAVSSGIASKVDKSWAPNTCLRQLHNIV